MKAQLLQTHLLLKRRETAVTDCANGCLKQSCKICQSARPRSLSAALDAPIPASAVASSTAQMRDAPSFQFPLGNLGGIEFTGNYTQRTRFIVLGRSILPLLLRHPGNQSF